MFDFLLNFKRDEEFQTLYCSLPQLRLIHTLQMKLISSMNHIHIHFLNRNILVNKQIHTKDLLKLFSLHPEVLYSFDILDNHQFHKLSFKLQRKFRRPRTKQRKNVSFII